MLEKRRDEKLLGSAVQVHPTNTTQHHPSIISDTTTRQGWTRKRTTAEQVSHLEHEFPDGRGNVVAHLHT